MESSEYVVLTDIMGLEDHLGDMDFKVTGTRDGITAMQMDIKIEGISKEIMKIALEKAKNARHYILDIFETVIKEPRKEISDTAPQIEQIKIPIDKIGELIGPGGKMIKYIIEQTQADINIKDDGTVSIASPDKVSISKAKAMISDIVSEPVYGNIYDGIVSRIEVYGAFVKFMSGTKEGLVHISQMHELRLNRVEDMLKIGDKVKVKYIGLDKGKYKLTMKGVKGNPEPKAGSTQSRNDGSRKSYHNNREHHERDNRGYHRRDRKY
jgi:polyribonucleotide nucleotidyltransferase